VALAAPGLAWLDIAPREAWPERARFDPYACNLRIRLIACADRAEVEHHFRYMPECVTLAAPAPAPESAAAPAPPIVLPPLAVELLEAQRRALAMPGRQDQVEDIAAVVRNIAASCGLPCPLGADHADAARVSAAIAALLDATRAASLPDAAAAPLPEGGPVRPAVPAAAKRPSARCAWSRARWTC
jgi:two-component system chemotaxis sensor kinase CheA